MTDAGATTTAGTVETKKAGSHPGWKWYVVHTYSGYEQKAKAALEERVRALKMEDKIGAVLSAEQIVKYVTDPKGVNPKAMMPPQKDNLTGRELEEVARFLSTLK